MARKPSVKSGSIVYEKRNPIDFLKQLTKWLCSKRKTTEDIKSLLELYRKDDSVKEQNYQKEFIFKRIISYCYNRPHITWYINKYLNNLFDFNSIPTLDLLYSISYIMDCHGHNKNSNFYFLKSSDFKDENRYSIKKVIKEYYTLIYDRHINDIELNMFYELLLKKEISIDEIILMDKAINGGENKLKVDELINIFETENEIEQYEDTINKEEIIKELRVRELPTNISKFCAELKELKKNRPECQKCKLFDKPMVVLDTNIEDFGVVDFAFYALNPGSEEVIYNKPLVDAAGTLHRMKMLDLPKDTKWLLTNVILCSTNNEKEIGKNIKEINQVSECCRSLILKIMEKFPARYYVPIGSASMNVFNIQGSITSKSGEIIQIGNNNYAIPLIHPSAVLRARGSNSEKAYNLGFDTIYEEANRLYSKQKQVIQNNIISNNININKSTNNKQIYYDFIPEDKIITEVTDDLTLFDITDLYNTHVLMIFLDENGNKKYLIKEYKIPIYVKNCNWDQCDMLIDNPDLVTYVNGFDRKKVLDSARDSLSLAKKLSVKG